jgi:hypothetical protein
MTYTQKLQSCLIDTGKAVEKMQDEKTPDIREIGILYKKFLQAVANDDMKQMAKESKGLTAVLMKWRVEKL